MAQPRRRHLFSLAERLGKTVKQLKRETDSAELAEWMAWDALKDKDFRKRVEHDVELERSRQMTPEQRAAAFKRLLQGAPNG